MPVIKRSFTFSHTPKINSNNREIQSLNQSNNDLRSYLNEEVSTDLNAARKELEDITNDKMLVLRKEIKLSVYPNRLGLHTPMPLEYIYVHFPESSNFFQDEGVNNIIQKIFAELDIMDKK